VTVTNDGPNVALDVMLLDELPAEVTFVSSDGDCALEPSGDLLCTIGDLEVDESVEIEVVVDVPPDLVFDASGPVTITNTATASSSIDDPDGANSSVAVDSTVVAVADLEVVSVEAIFLPTEALIGEDLPVTVRSTVRNLGPSTPIDADLTADGIPSAGASVSPLSDVTGVDALAVGSPQVIDQFFTIQCEAPGAQQVVFDVMISPANAADTDPDLANNAGSVVVEVECVVPIVINVRPANSFNRINLGSGASVPVAALTTGMPIDIASSATPPKPSPAPVAMSSASREA